MFWRKAKLIERDPKTLDLETLLGLQGALVAKLMLVNEELRSRYANLAELSQDLDASAWRTFTDGADRLKAFNALLETELTRITGRDR